MFWLSPDKWREEVAIAGFQQTVVRNGDKQWASRNTGYPPLRVLQLLQLVVPRKTGVIPPYETARLDHVSEKNNKGVKLECLRLSIRGPASDSVKKSEVCIEEDSHFLVEQTSVLGVTWQSSETTLPSRANSILVRSCFRRVGMS